MVRGASITHDFISEEEEAYLVRRFKDLKGITSGNGLYQLRYGTPVYAQKLVSNVVPEYLQVFCDRLALKGMVARSPRHVTVNHYTVGSSIGPHIDKASCGKVITILSLLSETAMVLSRGEERVEVVLPRRSLIQLAGESRYDWMHEVPQVGSVRYSVVFRD